MKLNIKLIPNSSKNEIVGVMSNEILKIKLTAPPINNKANKALIKLLSKHYKIPQKQIKIVSGLTSKNKIIEIKY